MALSSPGIGSNLDVNSIVTQLMTAESRPLTLLARKEAGYQARISAFGSLNSALGAFQDKVSSLSTTTRFNAVTAKAADDTIVKGTASSKAVAGTYSVDVTALAQAQSLSTAGQASTTGAIGDGGKTTLTFSFGTISGGKLENGKYVSDPSASQPDPAFAQDPDRGSGSVTIDSSNNSLQGIRDAINKANIGVTATIVSDGSANPYHLVLTSSKTGEKSSMSVAVSRDGSAPNDPANPAHTALADLLTYKAASGGTQNMTQNSAGQDAQMTVNGIAVRGATNTVREAIQGVTLDVQKIGTTNVTVARDKATVESNVSALVKAYNELDKTIKSLSSYNATTKVGGPLLGESSVRSIQEQVRKTLTGGAGVGGALSSLSQAGVSFEKDGTLSLDSAKLNKAMTDNFDDLAALFASTGSASDSLVSFVGSGNKTQAGTSSLVIDRMATRGSATGSAAPASLAITAGVNDKLELTINGVKGSVTLAAGSYTQDSLVTQIQSAINGTAAFSSMSIGVSVSADPSGKLSVTSSRYGAGSTVAISGNGAQNLFGSASIEGTAGLDVAGKINGIAATGSGQRLTGASGDAEGLSFEITGGSTGDRGTVTFSNGYASLLSRVVSGFVGTDGMVTRQTDGLKETIKDIGKSREAMQLKLAGIEKRYRAQFSALDTMISKMNTTSQFLSQQLTQISNLTSQS
ncbi:MAG TPA: flagellar filament capping protein FliD [Telluria sp.]|nr:flagellar filament capping protein FliD [Telluria sp.]